VNAKAASVAAAASVFQIINREGWASVVSVSRWHGQSRVEGLVYECV
jgi:hypothetical protein